MEEEGECNIGLGLGPGLGPGPGPGLGLGLGLGPGPGGGRHFTSDRKPPVQFHILFPPRLKEEEESTREEHHINKPRSKNINEEEDSSTEDNSDGGNNQAGMRKKLRLTKEQLALLESSFREHKTLNEQSQKIELADQLNLRPRQVEVWFQNRRARTKSKQTEVDCEFFKKCCENLRNENRRLKRELEELRAMESGCPFYFRVPKAATLTMCPSCKRIMASGSEKGNGPLDAMKGQLVPVNNGMLSL